MSESRGIYTLSAAHAGAVARLLADANVAAVLGFGAPLDEASVREWISEQVKARAEGRSYLFALTDGDAVLGLCGLLDAASDAPRLVVAVRASDRRRGHARFAGEGVLELAFQNLGLGRVVARAPGADLAGRRLLARLGFRETVEADEENIEHATPRAGGGSAPRAGGAAADRASEWELTREAWLEACSRSTLEKLHPSLRPILEAELAAGNEVVETTTGWPDPDSVFVRLKSAFRAPPETLPEGVEYQELNDPHWWKAEYRAAAPRHVLAY